MSAIKWRDILGWSDAQLEDLRLSGFTFLREGHYEKALLFFKTLLIVDASSAYDAQTLGALYLQMGKKEEALHALNHALKLDPVHEPTLLNKTKTLLMLDKKNEAFEIARQLQHSKDTAIANDASALVEAYS